MLTPAGECEAPEQTDKYYTELCPVHKCTGNMIGLDGTATEKLNSQNISHCCRMATTLEVAKSSTGKFVVYLLVLK